MREEFPVVNRSRGKMVAPRPVQEIACSRCGATDFLSATPTRSPAHTVAATFTRRGWRVGHVGKHVCPQCVATETASRRSARAAAKETSMPTEKAASAPASTAIVDLYMRLDDAYDRAAKRYRDGWTDERLASETGLSVSLVQERREHDFGPLVVDTTAKDLRAALVSLSAEAAAAVIAVKTVAGEARRLAAILEQVATVLGKAEALMDKLDPPAKGDVEKAA